MRRKDASFLVGLWALISVFVVVILGLTGCIEFVRPGGPTSPTAQPDPGPTSIPSLSGPFVSGSARVMVSGLDKIPWDKGDDHVLFVLEKQTMGEASPIVGVHIRGRGPRDAGVLLRWSADMDHDRRVYRRYGEHRPDLYCGRGHNYHHRARFQGTEEGVWVVVWDQSFLAVKLPSGAMAGLTMEGSDTGMDLSGMASFSSIRTELLPRRLEVYHLWQGFDLQRSGVKVELLELTGTPGPGRPCPQLN